MIREPGDLPGLPRAAWRERMRGGLDLANRFRSLVYQAIMDREVRP